jgi:Phage portal protein, lambda family
MKTLPELIADALIWCGAVSVITPAAAEMPACAPVVVVPKQDRRDLERSMLVTEPQGYDGDTEFIEAALPKMTLFDLSKPIDHLGMPYEVSATLYEASTDGQTYRLTKIEGRENLREAIAQAAERWESIKPTLNPTHMREARSLTREQVIEAAAKRLVEGGFDTGGGGYGDSGYAGSQGQSFNMNDHYGDGRDSNAEYIPLMGGPYSKQLYLYQYLDMHRKAFEAYNHNPIAHQLIEMTTAFVLGRGIDHQSTNNEVDAVWREFTERTTFYEDLENIANDLWWQGELMLEFYDNDPKKGLTDYRMIDPSTIWEIVTDSEDMQKVFYYHQQYSTPMQQYINDNNTQSTRYIIRQIPAGDVLHKKLNVSKYEKRGRTDLFSVLGWLKRLKDLMNARVVKGQLEAAFVFDIEINAGDAAVASASMQLPDAFKPGSNWVHNKNAQMKPVASGIRANESQPDIAALLNLISVGFGIPKEFIGEAGKGGRAGALVSSEPGTKRFEKRQRLVESIAQAVCDRVINVAVKAGKLDIDKALQDARSVQRLGKLNANLPTREDVSDEMQEKNDDAADEQKQQQADAMAQQQKMVATQGKQQHELALNDQQNQHRQALASIKGAAAGTKVVHTITEKRNTNVNESQVRSLRLVSSNDINEAASSQDKTATNSGSISADQKARMAAIKESGKYAKEFVEFIFPSIAQEDRSAKLKDLALAEAMQWLPKSVSATMAAKELNITTYSFTESWAQIVEEAEMGLSMAHVYAQDNQHTPATAMAQDVQEEQQAKQPIAPQNQMVNVPIPPAVAGDKLMPAQQKGGAPGGAGATTPGSLPNSGATKVNKHSGPNANDTDPTAKPHGYSAAANNPTIGAGASKIRKAAGREAAARKIAIYDQLLREAIGPATELRTQLAKTILANKAAAAELMPSIDDLRPDEDEK